MNKVLESIKFVIVDNVIDTDDSEIIELPLTGHLDSDYQSLYDQIPDDTYVEESDNGIKALDLEIITDYNPFDDIYEYTGNVMVLLNKDDNIELQIDKNIMELVIFKYKNGDEVGLNEIYTLNQMGADNTEYIEDFKMMYDNIEINGFDNIDDYNEYIIINLKYNTANRVA